MTTMANVDRRKKLAFRIRSFGRFLRTLFNNGKARAGLIVIIILLIIALFPFLFTPYNPLGRDIRTKEPVGPKYTVPGWYRVLPSFLGGDPTISENMHPIEDPGLPSLATNGGEFEFATDATEISAAIDPDTGYPLDVPFTDYVSKDGSLRVTFNRNAGAIANETAAYITRTFEYPFGSAPAQFRGNIDLLVKGSTHLVDSENYLDVPMKVNIYLEDPGKTRWNLWPPPYNFSGTYIYARTDIVGALRDFNVDILTGEVAITKPEDGSTSGWIIARRSNASSSSSLNSEGYASRVAMGLPITGEPVTNAFVDTPGNYTLGLELIFLDTEAANKTVWTSINIDNFDFFLWGNAQGLMGTDQEGRDLFAQVIHGTRLSLYLGIAVSVLTIALGLIVGLAAGYIGSFVDQALMRFNDLMLCLPTLPLLIVLAAVLGTTMENLMIILVLLGWNGFARVVRSLTLSLKERPFVEAAKAVGGGTGYTILKHILPNVMSVVYVSLATSVPGAVTAEASLSWLGFYDPTRMSWGRMLFNATVEGGTALAVANPFWIIVPGLMISLLAVSFILLGYALDEILNPRLRMRR